MQYTIITAELLETLIEKVSPFCLDGWTPVGGVAYDPDKKIYIQAIIKWERPNPPIEQAKEEKKNDPIAEFIGPELPEFSFEGWEEEFWGIVSAEFSTEALVFILKKFIRTIKQLLIEIKNKSFRQEAGEEIINELNGFIDKYNWTEEE